MSALPLLTAGHDTAARYGQLLNVYLAVTVTAGVIVGGAILVMVARYRSGRRAGPAQGPSKAPRLELGYAGVVGVVAAFLIGLTLHDESRVDATVKHPAVTIDVVASQWRWRFQYGGGVVTQGARAGLVVPAGEVVEFRLASRDVLHSFWIPELRFKRFAYPDHVNTFDLIFARTGTYSGACAEFCGIGHDTMRFAVRVLTPQRFAAWRRAQGRTAA